MKSSIGAAVFLVTAVGSAVVPGVISSARGQGPTNPSYTVDQAKRGHDAFLLNCAMLCHGDNLDNGDALPLKGEAFHDHWAGKGIDEPFALMLEKMPPPNPGSLPPATYADILAFILSKNGIAPGKAELPPDAAALKAFKFPN